MDTLEKTNNLVQIVDEDSEQVSSGYWNHRLFVTYFKHQYSIERWCTIREVYYDSDDNIVGITQNGVIPGGNTRDQLRDELSRMLLALNTKPELTPADIPGYVMDEYEITLPEDIELDDDGTWYDPNMPDLDDILSEDEDATTICACQSEQCPCINSK